jgi:H2-forming N5,N10-methylenetetrahydromethanopterin dehydrogenase-like enzyme
MAEKNFLYERSSERVYALPAALETAVSDMMVTSTAVESVVDCIVVWCVVISVLQMMLKMRETFERIEDLRISKD